MTALLRTDALLADFSVMAYDKQEVQAGSAKMPEGWELLDKEVKGSFAAFAYKSPSTNQVVIAYRGTDGPGDWLGANKDILLDHWTPQMTQAVDFAARVWDGELIKSKGNPPEIFVTGHSLGGAEAQIVSQMFGFDGMALDPLAAAKLTHTREFHEYAQRLTQTENGLGMPASFINYGVTESFVSHNTGQHLGERRPIPGMDLPNKELGKAALVAATVHPALGFASLLASDQIGSKHSSIPGSQAMRMLAELEAEDTRRQGHLFDGKVTFHEVTEHRPGPLNQQIAEKLTNTVLMKGEDGTPRALLKFHGVVQDRVLDVYTPDGKQQLYRVADPHAIPATKEAALSRGDAPAETGSLTDAQLVIVLARIQDNLARMAARGEFFAVNVDQEAQARSA